MHLKEGVCKACQKAAATALLDDKRKVIERTLGEAKASCDEYGAPFVPDKIQERIAAAFYVDTLVACQEACQKALQSLQTNLISDWSAGRIRGKPTVHSLERDAKNAEGLVKMLTKQGDAKGAASQAARADRLRAEAKEMQARPPKPLSSVDWSKVPYGTKIIDEADLDTGE